MDGYDVIVRFHRLNVGVGSVFETISIRELVAADNQAPPSVAAAADPIDALRLKLRFF